MFKCEYCEKEFKKKHTLNNHIRKTHNDEMPFKCELCGRGCGRLEDLSKHLKRNHKSEISVEEYWDKYLKNKNNQEHSSICRECGKDNKFKGLGNGYGHGFCSFSCSTTWYAKNTNRTEKAWNTIKKKQKEDSNFRLVPTQLQYWINKGYTKTQAKKLLSERQTTFSKEICIEKYGEEKGIKRWNKRQSIWQETLDSKPEEEKQRINKLKALGGTKSSFSNEAYMVFVELEDILIDKKICLSSDILYAREENGFSEMSLLKEDKESFYYYDFLIKSLNIIIEYNGSVWHPRPENFSTWKNPYPNQEKWKDMKPETLYKKDLDKIKLAEKNGYKLMEVFDYEKDKIQKCLDFIESNL